MAESCGNLQLIDDEILAECVASAIHKDNTEEKGTLLRQEQETRMTVNFLSKESMQELSAELCSLIEFVLNYDFQKRNAKERKSSVNKNFRGTEKKDTEPLDVKVVFSKKPEKINARATVRNNLLGDQDPRCLSKSHSSHYSKCRNEISAVYERSLKQRGNSTTMIPYLIPQRRESSSNGISSGKRKRFKVGGNIPSSVSDHHQSNPTSVYTFNKNSTNNNDINMHGRFREDDFQELIFKIYNEQLTLEEMLRCKTQGHFKPCNPSCHSKDVLDQPLFGAAPSPPRFLQKSVFNATAKPDVCLKISGLFKVPESGDCKEELFDAIHVPYFEEKRGVSKQLDELFSMKWSKRINFI